MSRHSSLRCVTISLGLLGLVVFWASTARADTAAESKVPKALLQQRLEAARSVYTQNIRQYHAAQAVPNDMCGCLCGWSERWLEAELALCDDDTQREKALRHHLDRTREVERIAVSFYRTGQIRKSDADAASYQRLQAEIRLWTEGIEPHPPKKPAKKSVKP